MLRHRDENTPVRPDVNRNFHRLHTFAYGQYCSSWGRRCHDRCTDTT